MKTDSEKIIEVYEYFLQSQRQIKEDLYITNKLKYTTIGILIGIICGFILYNLTDYFIFLEYLKTK